MKTSNGVKTLITTGIYPPDIGGPATYSKLLYDELPKHGISVKILSFKEVRRLPKIIRHIVYFFKILLKSRDIDVIYAQDPVSVGLPSVLVAKILGKRFVLKIVGDYAWEQYQNNLKSQTSNLKSIEYFQNERYDFITELRRKIERWGAKKAYKIIVPSQYLKKIVMMWGINENKINVIYNSFENPKIKISKEEIRKKLNLSGMILISAGRLVPWKGLDVLIEIMPDLLKEISDVKLYIIGSGPERENLESRIMNYELRNNVFLTGQISHDELMEYLSAGDIFILNSGYEGFSHLILEAMSVGIPVIVSNVGGNQEIIEDGENGLLSGYNNTEDMKKKIISLCRSELLRKKLIKNAKESVKKFNKEKMVNETMKILL